MATRKPQKPSAARKTGSTKKAAPKAAAKGGKPAAKKPAPAKKKAAPAKKAAAAARKPAAAPKKKAAAPAAKPKKKAAAARGQKSAASFKVPARKAGAVKKAIAPTKPAAKKSAGPARNQPAKQRAKAAVKAGAYGGDDSAPIRMTTTLLQTVELPASPAEVYRAYMDAPTHAKITGGTARIDSREGGRMSIGDGYIVGKFIELVDGAKIVQTWRTSEWPDGYEDSRLELSLAASDDGTRVTMVHESVPTEQAKAYEQGWIDYYWDPMRKFFTGGAAHDVREEDRDEEDAAQVVRSKAAEVYDDGDEDEDLDEDDDEASDDDDLDADDEVAAAPKAARKPASLDDLDDDDDTDDVIDAGDDDLDDIAPMPAKKAPGAPKAKVAKKVDDEDDAADDDLGVLSDDDDLGGDDDDLGDDDEDDEDDAD